MIRKIFILLLLLLPVLITAQDLTNSPEMADTLRGEGKIYVVVAVITIIFASIVFYLIRIDRKLGKLEKELKDK